MKVFCYHLSMIWRGILTLFKIEKIYMLSHLWISVLSPLYPYINIIMLARIVDELTNGKDSDKLVSYVLITICLNAIVSLLLYALKNIKEYRWNQFFKNETMQFAEKSMDMDYKDIESQKVNLLFQKIKVESQTGYNTYYLYTFLGEAIESIVNIIISLVLVSSLFANSAVPFSLKLMMIVLILVVAVTGIFFSQSANKIVTDMFDKFVPVNAVTNFYANYYNDYNTGKDIRLNGLEPFLEENQSVNDDECDKIIVSSKKKSIKYFLGKTVSSDMILVVSYLFVLYACMVGKTSVGDIAKYVTSIMLFTNSLSKIFSQVQSIVLNNKYLKNFFAFFDLPNQMAVGTRPVPTGELKFELKDVSFQYPGCEEYTLKSVSVFLDFREITGIVGKNGSGKTTLIKLLCRLYNPTSGVILLNGVDIREYDYQQYLLLFSTVFQDFKLFSFSLAQNIACAVDYDSEKLLDAINKAGFDTRYQEFSDGGDTPLYHDFDENGVEVSGGEAQKLAIARAFYKNAPFFILDEPTSALDPIAEYEAYHSLNRFLFDKTGIFITHRLSSCKFCNQILVIDDGQIVQRGSHDDLLKDKQGLYSVLWEAQAKHYR